MQILYRCWGWNRGTNGPGFSGKLMPSEKSLASVKWDSTRRDLSVNNGLSVKQVSKSLTPELWIQIDSPNFTYPINVGGHSKLVQLVISAIKHLGHTDIQVIPCSWGSMVSQRGSAQRDRVQSCHCPQGGAVGSFPQWLRPGHTPLLINFWRSLIPWYSI